MASHSSTVTHSLQGVNYRTITNLENLGGGGECTVYGSFRFTEEDAGSSGTPVYCSGTFRIILVNLTTLSSSAVTNYYNFYNTEGVDFSCELDPVSYPYAYFAAFDACIWSGPVERACRSNFYIHNFWGDDNSMHGSWSNPWTYADVMGAFEVDGCIPINSDPDEWSATGCVVSDGCAVASN